MNTDDTVQDVDINADEDLEVFEQDFFNPGAKQEVVEDQHEPDEEDDDESEEDNPLEPDEDEDDDEHEEDDRPRATKRKNSAQERINELVADKHELRRQMETMAKEFEAFKASVEKRPEESKEIRDRLPPEAPNPDMLDEKGEPLYKLGEFDPQYIRDLTKFTIEQETKAAKEQAEREAQQAEMQRAQQEIADKWIERVNEVEKELPDLRDRMQTLAQTFQDIEPNYGEYLATAIMQSEVGPQIMHYLSQNIGEAQSIVASGPVAATFALGRLEAKLSSPAKEDKSNKIVSNAPEPPEDRVRGRQGRFKVSPDTEDLEAFEREFYADVRR